MVNVTRRHVINEPNVTETDQDEDDEMNRGVDSKETRRSN